MKVKIISKLETSDHDGYCSGEECEYECKHVETIVPVPNMYKSYPKGKINDLDKFDWIKLLPEPDLNTSGSYYCDNSDECETKGLGSHDYRYTILSVEIFDEENLNSNSDSIENFDMKKIYED